MAQNQDYRILLSRVDSLKSIYGQFDEHFLNAYDEAIQSASLEGENETALKLRQDYVGIISIKYGEESLQYAEGLARLGNGYAILNGSIDDTAMGYYLRAKSLFEKKGDEQSDFYGTVIFQLLNG